MEKKGVRYDTVTYTTLIDGYDKIGNLEEENRLFKGMEKRGVRPNVVTCNVLIDGYGKKGKLEEAKQLFKEMENIGGRPDEALRLYDEMIEAVITLNERLYSSIAGSLDTDRINFLFVGEHKLPFYGSISNGSWTKFPSFSSTTLSSSSSAFYRVSSCRLSIRQAMQVLHFKAALPNLPSKMPVPVYYMGVPLVHELCPAPCYSAMATSFFNLRSLSIFVFYLLLIPYANSISFNISRFDPDNPDILYEGDARAYVGAVEFNSISYLCHVGHATYAKRVHLWDSETNKLTDFTTHFSFSIDTGGCSLYAAGLAFYLAPFGYQIPPNSAGGFLGLFNTTTSDSSQNRIVLVEFDSFPNPEWDPYVAHVRINNNSIASVVYTPWNASFHSGDIADVSITYNATTKNMSVSWAYQQTSDWKEFSTLSYQFDLMKILLEWVSIGFSAATSHLVERHQLLSWEFSSSLNTEETNEKKVERIRLEVGIAASVGILIVGAVIAYYVSWTQKYKNNEEEEEAINLPSINDDLEKGSGPKRMAIDPLEQNSQTTLVEWIWELYGEGDILSAVDERIHIFDETQAECLMIVGLWCAHPDSTLRPSIRQAIQVLNFEAPMPILPAKMPITVHSSLVQSVNSSEPSI
ncbi:hypothetical protein QYF36_007386 [Acer negundo]|nr:hypothetical protein QYF36_007386 [Acer negundo]